MFALTLNEMRVVFVLFVELLRLTVVVAKAKSSFTGPTTSFRSVNTQVQLQKQSLLQVSLKHPVFTHFWSWNVSFHEGFFKAQKWGHVVNAAQRSKRRASPLRVFFFSCVQLHGTLRVVMEPLLGDIPLVGALSVFFLKKPVSTLTFDPQPSCYESWWASQQVLVWQQSYEAQTRLITRFTEHLGIEIK